MTSDTAQAAIDCALKHNWEKAIELNKQIITENPTDIEALNRLAFAYMESGNYKEAKKTYHKVLDINRFNQITLKNLKRLALVMKNGKAGKVNTNTYHTNNFAGLFLEEIGKTKVVSLINLAEAKILSILSPTDQVVLIPRRRGVSVTTHDNDYIGALPDDIARRLFILIGGGNTYEAYVKSVDKNGVSIFIKEVVRAEKFRNQPSFLGKGSSTYFPSIREDARLGEDKPDVSTLEELDDDIEDGLADTVEEES